MPISEGRTQLLQTVVERELCTLCGACLSLCPYLRGHGGRVVDLHDCDLDNGRCFASCPRTGLDPEQLERVVFGEPGGDVTLGRTVQVLMARAKGGFRDRAQCGGTVTALVLQALAEQTISLALLTRRDREQLPRPVLARSAEEVLACSGSSYVAGGALERLGSQDIAASDRVGVVGLPCQVQALARMRAAGARNGAPNPREDAGLTGHPAPNTRRDPADTDPRKDPAAPVELVIGLFCTWALSWEPFRVFLDRELGGRRVYSIDISPPPERFLLATTDRGDEKVPLDRVRELIQPGCGVCIDLTAELADISVGAAEQAPGWNTVIVRSRAGARLLEQAMSAGALETRPLPDEDLAHLRAASVLKKQRAVAALERRGAPEQGYLTASPKWLARVRAGEQERT